MPELVTERAELRRRCEQARQAGRAVGFVPTMGALHEGHLALLDAARREGADFLVASIFVNPLQFGEGEDFQRYPRTLQRDLEACAGRGVDVVFAPEARHFYPPDFSSRVVAGGPVARWEGAHRPGHFDGVATVLTKLFSLVGPSVAVFGRKDFQQWRVVERLVEDLDLPVRVVGHPIVREPDGLARSSRNLYLSEAERPRALAIPGALTSAHDLWSRGERRAEVLGRRVEEVLGPAVDEVDYVAVVDARTLEPLCGEVADEPCGPVVLVAARVGTTRLIDNLWLGVDDPPQRPAGD